MTIETTARNIQKLVIGNRYNFVFAGRQYSGRLVAVTTNTAQFNEVISN